MLADSLGVDAADAGAIDASLDAGATVELAKRMGVREDVRKEVVSFGLLCRRVRQLIGQLGLGSSLSDGRRVPRAGRARAPPSADHPPPSQRRVGG